MQVFGDAACLLRMLGCNFHTHTDALLQAHAHACHERIARIHNITLLDTDGTNRSGLHQQPTHAEIYIMQMRAHTNTANSAIANTGLLLLAPALWLLLHYPAAEATAAAAAAGGAPRRVPRGVLAKPRRAEKEASELHQEQ
jgi:hypothetical protein